MKFKSLLFAAAFAGLFSSCSNEIDEIVSDNDNKQTEQGDAYASFSFLMPNAEATRATGGIEVGTSEENQITNVGVYMFDATTQKYSKTISLVRADFTPTTVGGATLYSTIKPQEVSEGKFNVYVIVNPTSQLASITASTTLAQFQAFVESVPQTTGEYCTNNKFMMTNAEQIVETTVAKANNIKNPALVSVKVERLAAKVTFNALYSNSYKIKNETGSEIGSVVFDAYKVINTRNSAYNLKRVGDVSGVVSAIGGAETTSNYVIENFFTQKTETFEEGVYTPNYSRKYNTYVAFRKLNNTGAQTLAYALENTMKKEAQMMGYSSAVILRAKATLDYNTVRGTVNAEGDLYRYLNKFYASLLDIIKSVNPDFTVAADGRTITGLNNDIFGIKAALAANNALKVDDYLTSINNITTLKNTYNVEYFVKGYCYYTTWFRHSATAQKDDVLDIMEYVMVRNNVYKLSISSVSMIGSISSGTPGPIDPSNPTQPGVDEPATGTNPEIPGTIVPNPEPTDPVIPFEPEQPIVSAKTYLNVSIEVLPWTVRDNSVDL